jgi:ABC-type maltose transport system permease subunit
MGDIDISGNKVLTPTALSNKEFAIGADTITVSFNANGGTAPIPASKQVSLGNAYGQLATTTRTGYNFINWLLNSTVITANSIVTEPNNHTLTAS